MTTSQGGERNGTINSQLWHACAGPLLNLPPVGSLVVYFPQGHSEQVAASMQKKVDAHVPNYSNLPSKLICLLHNVTLHADPETDDVYAQMTLQPVNNDKKETLLGSDHVLSSNRRQTEFFCKTLTASDTSTHGGLSVPRRAAEKIFPPLDFSMQPPIQELQARDLHNNLWTFRHIYRGQPKRHLLTTGWSHFVSGKHLSAGDSVLFIKDEKSELLVGIRRSNNQSNNISSSVLSSDNMLIGILAAAAHAAANNSPFTVFYNPRASPAEFVIPLAKYNAAIFNNNISLGMRFRMVFETEESGTRRYMGTITGINDLDPVRWKNSQWRNLQVGWDESGVGEKCNRVSLWEIEPVVAPFFIYPPPFFGAKHPRQPGIIEESSGMENLLKRIRPWLGEEILKDSQFQNTMMPGLNQLHLMNMQQNSFLNNANMQSNHLHSLAGPVLQSIGMADLPKHLNSVHIPTHDDMQLIMQNSLQKTQQMNQIPNSSAPPNQFGRTTLLNQQQPQDFNLASTDAYPSRQFHNPLVQAQIPMANQQQQTSYSQNLQCLQNANLLDQLKQIAQHQQFLQQQQASMPVGTHGPIDQCPQNLSEEVHAQMLQKLQQHSLPLQPTKQQCQPVKDKQNSVLGDLRGHVDTFTFTKHGPESQHIVPNSSIAVQCSQLKIPVQQMEQMNDVFSSSTTTNNHGLVLPQTVINKTFPGQAMTNQTSSAMPNPKPEMDDVFSSSTTTNNHGLVLPQTVISKTFPGQAMTNQTSSAMPNPKPDIFEALATTRSIDTYLQRDYNEVDLTPSALKILDSYACLHAAPQMDVLNPYSLVTPACLSGSDGELNQIFPTPSHQPLMFENDSLGIQHRADNPGKNDLSPVNFGNTAGALPPTETLLTKTINTGNSNSISSEEVVIHYNSKEAQQDLSTSYVSQSFGVPDVAFNSLDDNIKDSNLNKNSFASQPQLQRKRTYTKVYMRGAVGRSIDVTRFSGYTELKQELARMFSLGGHLEDLQRLGWKLVYVDLENDVLLVGDDPWEEFVSCVRCIRILSPQEVKQMSLDDDVGSKMPPTNQTCSSDDRHVWQDDIGQDHVNPCGLPFGHFG